MKFGFTLAEVLITLLIVGIISSIVIPGLIQDSQHAETVAMVKKYQYVLSNVLKRYMTENGCVGNIATCGFYDKSSNDTVPVAPIVLMDELKPYFNNLRNCDSSAGCSAESRYKFLNGLATRNFNTNSSLSKSISVDGSYILFADYTGNCTYNSSKTNIEPLLYTCGWLGIDVNGNKGPNVGGRDFFGWYIVNTGQLIPFGISDDNLNRGCDPANTGTDWDDPGSGFGCTARVIKEDKINY